MESVEEDAVDTRKELRPIHGILSLHGRKKSQKWTCLVCSTAQPSIEQACSTCNRDRVPSWLLDANGRALLPGSVVRCPRDAVTYVPPPAPVEPAESTSPPRPASRSKLKSPPIGKIAAALCISPRATLAATGRNATRSPSGGHGRTPSPRRSRQNRPPISPRASSSPASHSTNKSETPTTPRTNRGSAAQFVSIDEGNGRSSRVASRVNAAAAAAASPRGKKPSTLGNASTANSRPGGTKKGGRQRNKLFEAASARVKTKFDGQSGNDRVVMVVAVNSVRPLPPRAARSLEGICVVEGDDGKTSSASLVKVVLDMTKGHKLEVVNQNLEQEEYRKFLDFGVCGRCDRTYRIVDGGRHVLPKSTEADTKAEVTHLQQLVDKGEQRKQALKAMGDYAATAEATSTLRGLRDKIARHRRFLEPIVLSCPFCRWNGGALFAATTTT